MAVVSKPASQNLAVVILTAYLSSLARHPLVTKACTTATLNFMQEEIAQRVSGVRADERAAEKRASLEGHPVKKSLIEHVVNKRVLQFSLYGLFISGPLNHFLYEVLNKVFANRPKGKLTTLLSLLAQNLIISPILNSVFLAANAIIAGERSAENVINIVRSRLLGMMKVSWVVFPCVQLFAARFLPPLVWVPFFNAIAFTFGTYFNTQGKIRFLMAKRAEEDKEEKSE
ncbi:hypothetical protein LPJ73_006979 [Coemansia sp. RSA 2703]|nr:hypothetical protein LPJ73_006979 [Coemansia sp. RSA 2703]KAJ2362715.1 hypothetical protein IW150_006936 [Coemansia sp. RSA 2607]KAJ2380310.1 hypothetical protein GGI05_006349 [Coemansia sp. RSA 2603]